jgi:hypothetical protein
MLLDLFHILIQTAAFHDPALDVSADIAGKNIEHLIPDPLCTALRELPVFFDIVEMLFDMADELRDAFALIGNDLLDGRWNLMPGRMWKV